MGSWDNRRSFWIQREYLLQAIHDVGFDLVMEQFDSLGPNIAENMLGGYYKTNSRGTFIGIKTGNSAKSRYVLTATSRRLTPGRLRHPIPCANTFYHC